MEKVDPSLYIVKVRRYYGSQEATSILHGPVNRDFAERYLRVINSCYRDPDAYYIEKWGREKIK